jgi:hypothetical protein
MQLFCIPIVLQQAPAQHATLKQTLMKAITRKQKAIMKAAVATTVLDVMSTRTLEVTEAGNS